MRKKAGSVARVASMSRVQVIWSSAWIVAALGFLLLAVRHMREEAVLAMGWCGNSPLGGGALAFGAGHCAACFATIAALIAAFTPLAVLGRVAGVGAAPKD